MDAARKSDVAIVSHSRHSSIFAGSCGIQNLAFPLDRGGQRSLQVELPIKFRSAKQEHIRCERSPDEGSAGQARIKKIAWGIVRHDEQEIVIALRACVASRLRAEQIDFLGMESFYETLDDLIQRRLRPGSFRAYRVPRHVYSLSQRDIRMLLPRVT